MPTKFWMKHGHWLLVAAVSLIIISAVLDMLGAPGLNSFFNPQGDNENVPQQRNHQ